MKKLILILLAGLLFSCAPTRVLQKFAEKPVFECNFSSMEELLEKFCITDNEFYNQFPVMFSKDMVEITPEGLVIKCIKESGTATTWQKTGAYEWRSGNISTWNNDSTFNSFSHKYGTWVVEAIFPNTWAALWLLHPDYYVPELGKNHITPETDFAENNGNAIDNVVHYGWHPERYSTKFKLKRAHKYDGKLHEYAVQLLPDRYNFYLDGKLVNSFQVNDPDFYSDQPNYLRINNAVKAPYESESEFIIKSVKYYR